MDARLLVGIELPALRALDPDTSLWWESVRAAAASAAGVLWFAGSGAALACDPIPLAAAAAATCRPDQHVGIVGVIPAMTAGRHPSVLAREVTSLDVVSGGRGAVLLRGASPEQLIEAAAVCAAVFSGGAPVFEGRHFHVAGASNLPRPVQVGGVPIFVEMPDGAAASLMSHKDRAPLRLLTSTARALVCSDDPREVAHWRAAADSGGPGAPSIVCRRREALTAGASPTATRDAHRERAVRDAGADGVIVTLQANRDGVARVLAAALEHWIA